MFAGKPLYPVAITRRPWTRTHPHFVEGSLLQEQTSWAILRKRRSHFVSAGLEVLDVFNEGIGKLFTKVFPCVKLDTVLFRGVYKSVPACLEFQDSKLNLHEGSCLGKFLVASSDCHHLLEGAL